jgi:hypothetical protein
LIIGRYFFLGIGLSFVGTTTSVVSYFLAHIIPLTALGIAAVIVGVTAASLPEEVSASYAMKTLLRGSTLGIDPLLEEIEKRQQIPGNQGNSLQSSSPSPAGYPLHDLEEIDADEEEGDEEKSFKQRRSALRAIYLPPKPKGQVKKEDDARGSVYVPLVDHIPSTLDEMRAAPTTLLPEEKAQAGIRVYTPGAYLGLVEEVNGEDVTIEDALQYVLVESAELCSVVRAAEIEDTIVLEIDDVKVEPESRSYRNVLGSFPTSLAACIVSTVKGAPVMITNEDITPTRTVARLLIFDGAK